ncbi:histidine kinase [Occallatibacter riparius]|uniref:Histidine kinase n=1 Tax=Occallatibacter riparius TaxID=1002689 RepID=A0A9J7BNQ3_9BACT|nr:histidine kinase [Occallatibacter riparius]UWZ84145.1 histidine kinase [Occallatibacter riparius]
MKMRAFVRRRIWIAVCLCIGAGTAVLWSPLIPRPLRVHAYLGQSAKGDTGEWTALGGTWEIADGAMRNDSDERGAKLLAGSTHWRNYSVEADITLLGQGDAGLLIRSSKEEAGVDAYSGYYTGIRTLDNSLVLGRAEHGWKEITKKVFAPEGIQAFQRYHLKVLAYGCEIVSAVSSRSHPIPESIHITDPSCVSSGRIGLRSYRSGGIWSNVVVRPAQREDLAAMLRNETDRGTRIPGNPPAANSAFIRTQSLLALPPSPKVQVQSIESLRLEYLAHDAAATIRGVVNLTSPMLFVEDSTGGVYVRPNGSLNLKVGDEVEVSGMVHSLDFGSVINDASVRVLWESIPMAPMAVSATQASTGKFEATFIEVQGRLSGKGRGPGNTLILHLEDGGQSFRALMNPGRGAYVFDRLKVNSMLNLRGVCVVDPLFTGNVTPFVLLLRSSDDVTVLSGPPWWSTGHVITLLSALLLTILAGAFIYHRVQNWRLRAILGERERLAHEMHDTLAQSFAGIGFQLQAIQNGLPAQESTLHKQLEFASNLVHHSHEEARRSIAMLRTEALESEDLLSALDRNARSLVEGGSIRVVSESSGEPRAIPLRIADAFFRVGMESIANSIRHASPSELRIRILYGENTACLRIEDDGCGFVPGDGLKGFGIRGMRLRAQGVSANFRLHSTPGEGTRVEVEAPLPPRLTFSTMPKLLWKFLMEFWNGVQSSKLSNSHSYRG